MIENTPMGMIPITDLQVGDDFYFTNNRGTIYTVLSFLKYPNGDVKSIRSVTLGKLHPVYFSWRTMIVKVIKSSNDKKENTTTAAVLQA